MSPPSEGAARGSSLPGFWRYPERRDALTKSTASWMADRRKDVDAKGLWRVHDTLYDLESFVDKHPGGSDWLRFTKGTDITEAFEAHHISPMPARLLSKFAVKPAANRRNSPYTFHEDGLYATLRRRVYAVMPDAAMRGASTQSRILVDSMVATVFALALLAAAFQSFTLAVLSGVLLSMTTDASHNFFHLKENWRSYYFDLSMLSSQHWRISHALSHHLFPNSIYDLEVSLLEPLLNWLPREDKSHFWRYFSWLASPVIYLFMLPFEYAKRVLMQGPRFPDLLPLVAPAAMLALAALVHEHTLFNLLITGLLWVVLVLSCSLYFGIVGVNAAHHHPELFHDGDAPREDMDWGLAQLDAVTDRPDISGVRGSVDLAKDGRPEVLIDTSEQHWWTFFLVMTNFGHHTLHHLFPTVDHARLPLLYPALQQTLSEFKVPFRTHSTFQLTYGQFRQLANNKPNPHPPGYIDVEKVKEEKAANEANSKNNLKNVKKIKEIKNSTIFNEDKERIEVNNHISK